MASNQAKYHCATCSELVLHADNRSCRLLQLCCHQCHQVSLTYMYRTPSVSSTVDTALKGDVYALGCLLVEMCTGEPWASGLFTAKIFQESEADCLPALLVGVITRCLNSSAGSRLTAREVLQVLVSLLCLWKQVAASRYQYSNSTTQHW